MVIYLHRSLILSVWNQIFLFTDSLLRRKQNLNNLKTGSDLLLGPKLPSNLENYTNTK
jgi:hypothetical protein